MKTILFPTDFSPTAQRAFVYALHLANRFEARIITLHAFNPAAITGLIHVPSNMPMIIPMDYDLHEFESFRSSINVLREIQYNIGLSHIDLSHILEVGPTIPVILEKAISESADLIVMGTTGASGLKELFLGSIAGEILENASCPVLAIPEQAVFDEEINEIVFPFDFSSESKLGLQQILILFKRYMPIVHGVHIDLTHTSIFKSKLQEWKEAFTNNEKVSLKILEGNDFYDTLTNFTEFISPDLIVMITHQRSFWEEFFTYSRTKSLSYHSHIPILSIPASMLSS